MMNDETMNEERVSGLRGVLLGKGQDDQDAIAETRTWFIPCQ